MDKIKKKTLRSIKHLNLQNRPSEYGYSHCLRPLLVLINCLITSSHYTYTYTVLVSSYTVIHTNISSR